MAHDADACILAGRDAHHVEPFARRRHRDKAARGALGAAGALVFGFEIDAASVGGPARALPTGASVALGWTLLAVCVDALARRDAAVRDGKHLNRRTAGGHD